MAPPTVASANSQRCQLNQMGMVLAAAEGATTSRTPRWIFFKGVERLWDIWY